MPVPRQELLFRFAQLRLRVFAGAVAPGVPRVRTAATCVGHDKCFACHKTARVGMGEVRPCARYGNVDGSQNGRRSEVHWLPHGWVRRFFGLSVFDGGWTAGKSCAIGHRRPGALKQTRRDAFHPSRQGVGATPLIVIAWRDIRSLAKCRSWAAVLDDSMTEIWCRPLGVPQAGLPSPFDAYA